MAVDELHARGNAKRARFALPQCDDDQRALERVIHGYRRDLRLDTAASAFRAAHSIDEATADHFELGYADGRLIATLAHARSLPGLPQRGQLMRLGLLRPSGHEHFKGCLIFPIRESRGRLVDIYGYRIARYVPSGKARLLSLSRPSRGLFNARALFDHSNITLYSCPLRALQAWIAGDTAAIAGLGAPGIRGSQLRAIAGRSDRSVVLAGDYDTEPSDLRGQLQALGVQLLVSPPERIDS